MSAEFRGTSWLCRVARGAESAFVLPIRFRLSAIVKTWIAHSTFTNPQASNATNSESHTPGFTPLFPSSSHSRLDGG